MQESIRQQIKIGFLTLLGIAIIWLFIAVIMIDFRWWWFSLFVFAFFVVALYLCKDDLKTPLFRKWLSSFCMWSALYGLMLVLTCAIFVSPWFWLGSIIVFGMILLWIMLKDKQSKSPKSTTQIIPAMTTAVFVLLFCLSCLPAVIVNNNPLPNNSYNHDPEKIYVLYGGDLATANKEHIYAQSWFTGVNSNRVNDNHNVIYANPEINSQRGNKKFGNGIDEFAPTDDYKGDVARALLYMYVTYKNISGFDKHFINVNLMKEWANIDPVSNNEIKLNTWIKTKSKQKNGNPFIDSPGLVYYVV